MFGFYIGFAFGVISTIAILMLTIFTISSETFHYKNLLNFIHYIHNPERQDGKNVKIISEKEITEEANWLAKLIENIYKAKVSFFAIEFDRILKNYFSTHRHDFDSIKLTRVKIVLDPNITIEDLNISHIENDNKFRIKTKIDTQLSKILLNLMLTIDVTGKSFIFIPLELEVTKVVILVDFVVEYKDNILTIILLNSDINVKINYTIGSESKLITPINIDKLAKNCIQYLIVQNPKILLSLDSIYDIFMSSE